MTAVAMIGTPGATGVAMGCAMTIVGVTIAASAMPTGDGMIAWMTTGDATTAASAMPTGDGMIAWMTIAAGMIGGSAMATDGATIATSGTTIDAVRPDWLFGPSGFGPGWGAWADLGRCHSKPVQGRRRRSPRNTAAPGDPKDGDAVALKAITVLEPWSE
jgi:hypothetical protein